MSGINGLQTIFTKKSICISFGLLILFSITTFALAAAILGVVVNRLDKPSVDKSGPISLVDQIKIDDLMKHLEQLQVFADRSNGTRAIATSGFNDTLDYITTQLEQNTNLIIKHQYFTVRNYIIQGTPQLRSQINGNITNHTYVTDFAQILFSSSANFDTFVQVVAIPNYGCTDADWMNVSVNNSVALVLRGNCTYVSKSVLAEKYQVKGLLIYNDGLTSSNLQPIQGVRNNLNTTIPAYFLSYDLGMQLRNAINSSVMMNINVSDANGIGNICADTPSGDKTKTIVVGSHSDGVPAGSGINDNGSGTVGNLILALNLARLFQTSSSNYPKYPYRVRFCWWGAEEHGLIGSIYHVEQARSLSNPADEGERLQDYLVNFNYDMLAGPNYRFGIHDSSTVPETTPSEARNGTTRITNVFRQWFQEQKLPWSNAPLTGGSDYVPFLAAGIAVGGVNTGAGGIKSDIERDLYSAALGTGNGGLANAQFDPCYHQKCDRITNINPFAYEKVVKAAAYALEYLGKLDNLDKWLYPPDGKRNVKFYNKKQFNAFQNDPEII